MNTGWYRVSPDPKNEQDILFEPVGSGDPPGPQRELHARVERTLSVVRGLLSRERMTKTEFTQYFVQLLSLAQSGLVGDGAAPDRALQTLDNVRAEVTNRYSGRVKNDHLMALGAWALAFSGVGVAITLLTDMPAMNAFATLWIGAMVGVWLSFAHRKREFAFDDLYIPEKDHLSPALRLVFAGCLTIIIGILASLGAFQVKIGSASTADLVSDLRVAFVLGTLCGFSEIGLSDQIARRAKAIENSKG